MPAICTAVCPQAMQGKVVRAPVVAVDCQNDIANAAAERRAPQHGLFAQRAREQDAVKVRAVARLDALGEHGDDEPVALPALVVKRAQRPTMRRLCTSSTGQTRSSASLATMTGMSFWPDRRSTRRENLSNRRVWFSCEKTGSPAATPQLHSSGCAPYRTPQHSFVGVSYEKERGDMPCRARGQKKKKSPSFDGSFFCHSRER